MSLAAGYESAGDPAGEHEHGGHRPYGPGPSGRGGDGRGIADTPRPAAGDTEGRAVIDLNVDAGESFGRWRVAEEGAVFRHVTTVNLACGFHAGDPANLLVSIELALQHGLALGAHPGYPDLVGFGRRAMQLSREELVADTIYQLGALAALVRAAGSGVAAAAPAGLHHVKAHGALYNQMLTEPAVARAFVEAVATYDVGLPVLVLAGPGGDVMRRAVEAAGLRAVAEAFPDRAYLRDGTLAPRQSSGSVLDEPADIAVRAVAMATGTPFAALDGGETRVSAATLCLHGDGASAPAAAAAVRLALERAGLGVEAF